MSAITIYFTGTGEAIDLSRYKGGPYRLGTLNGVPMGLDAQGRYCWAIDTQAGVDQWNEYYSLWLMLKP